MISLIISDFSIKFRDKLNKFKHKILEKLTFLTRFRHFKKKATRKTIMNKWFKVKLLIRNYVNDMKAGKV
jgi:hypothetical protein